MRAFHRLIQVSAIVVGIAFVTSTVQTTRPLHIPGPFVSTSKHYAQATSADGSTTTTDAETWRVARNGRTIRVRSHVAQITIDADHTIIDDTMNLDVYESGHHPHRTKPLGARTSQVRLHITKGPITGNTRQDTFTPEYDSVLGEPITVSVDLALEQLGYALTPQQRASYMDRSCETCMLPQGHARFSLLASPVFAQPGLIYCLQFAVRQCYYWLFFGPEAFDLCTAIWASICYFVETSGGDLLGHVFDRF